MDLRKANHRLWLNLGEASSKCEHLAGVPLRPETHRLLHNIYLAKGIAATTAIEGNTLTEEEVCEHLAGRLKLPPSKEYQQREVDNMVKAFAHIYNELVETGSVTPLSTDRVRELHRLILEGLPTDDEVLVGDWRRHSVVVGNVYRGAPAEDVPYLMERLCTWLEGPDFQPPDAKLTTVFAILKAVIAHLYVAWIHPFGDGNSRVARLMEFYALLSAGVPSTASHVLSNHYNQTRSEYYRQLDRASKSGGDVMPLLEYAVQGFVDGLRDQLKVVREQQLDIAWRDFVHSQFHGRVGEAQRRQRDLALAIADFKGPFSDWIPIADLSELNPSLAKAYARKSQKTLQRDLVELERMQLIEKSGREVRAKTEVILAFLPARNAASAKVIADRA